MQVGEAQELLGEPATAYCVPRKMYAALAPQFTALCGLSIRGCALLKDSEITKMGCAYTFKNQFKVRFRMSVCIVCCKSDGEIHAI